jgi:hypothetical protein
MPEMVLCAWPSIPLRIPDVVPPQTGQAAEYNSIGKRFRANLLAREFRPEGQYPRRCK